MDFSCRKKKIIFQLKNSNLYYCFSVIKCVNHLLNNILFFQKNQCFQYHDYIDMYTDGSKTNNLVSCGVVCRNIILSYCLPTFFSVVSAEFLTIKITLKYFSSPCHKRFIIYADSKSVLKALQSNSFSSSFISVLQLNIKLCDRDFISCFVGSLHMWVQKATKLLIKQLNGHVSH